MLLPLMPVLNCAGSLHLAADEPGTVKQDQAHSEQQWEQNPGARFSTVSAACWWYDSHITLEVG